MIKTSTIRKFREKAVLTQSELAKRLGVTQSSIAQWETNESLPRADKLPQLAQILGCKIDDLFEQERERVNQ